MESDSKNFLSEKETSKNKNLMMEKQDIKNAQNFSIHNKKVDENFKKSGDVKHIEKEYKINMEKTASNKKVKKQSKKTQKNAKNSEISTNFEYSLTENEKNAEIEKKIKSVEDKNYFVSQKNDSIEIKEDEVFAKLNQTNVKQSVEIEKNKKFLDNTEKSGKIGRLIIVISFFVILIGGGYLALKLTGAWESMNSPEKIKEFILSGGNWSVLIFIIIQFLQVTFLPLPAFVTTVAGALIFGPLNAFIMSFIAIMLGSVFAFWLGRKFGMKILVWITGKDDAEKWSNKLTNGKYLFFLMMLFPIFPDDVLCIAAGVTKMSFKFFFITNLITRPIGIFCICFLGSGMLIPFSGYGLIVWPILIILLIIAFIISIKYQSQIEAKVESLSKKIKGENKNNKNSKNENNEKNINK